MKRSFFVVALAGFVLLGASVLYAAIPGNEVGDDPFDDPDGDPGLTVVPLTGYAWSSNIGWIRFDHGQDDGVELNQSTHKLSGYAWSSNIGWIRFDPQDPVGQYPAAGNDKYGAKLVGNTLKGWARACVAYESGCAGAEKASGIAGPELGGWDGWIKMSGTASDGTPYRVTREQTGDSYTWRGFAWGGDVVGWVKFNVDEAADCDDPGYDGVCDGDNNSPLYASCSVLPGGQVVLPAGGSVTARWTAIVTDGEDPFDYSWSSNNSNGPTGNYNNINFVDVVYDSLGVKTGQVSVTDQAGDSVIGRTCSNNLELVEDILQDCENGRDDDGDGKIDHESFDTLYPEDPETLAECTSPDDPSEEAGGPSLSVNGSSVTKITSQPLSSDAFSSVIKIDNIGTTDLIGGRVILNQMISRVAPPGRNLLQDDVILNGEENQELPLCYFGADDTPASGEFDDCGTATFNLSHLPPNNSIFFSLKVHRPVAPIKINNPYDFSIGTAQSSVPLVFNYLVGQVLPR